MRDAIIDDVLTKQIRIPTHEPGLLDNHIVSHSHGKPKSRLTMKFVVFLTFTLNSTHFFFISSFSPAWQQQQFRSNNSGGLENLHVLFCHRQFSVPRKSCTPQSHRGSKDLERQKSSAYSHGQVLVVYSKILAPTRGSRSLVRHESSTEAEFEG